MEKSIAQNDKHNKCYAGCEECTEVENGNGGQEPVKGGSERQKLQIERQTELVTREKGTGVLGRKLSESKDSEALECMYVPATAGR